MSNVRIDRSDRLATVTVERPSRLNALDRDTIDELQAAFASLAGDAGVGVIVLTGSGDKAFIAGADIGGLAEQGVLDGCDNARHGQVLTLAIENAPQPVIAAINGFALGGGLEMALACDLRYAARSARLGLPEVSLGIIPGYGGTQRLARLIGSGKALEMVLTGDAITADEALRVGLVNGVFEPAELQAGVRAVAEKILSRGPTAIRFAKQAVRRGADLPIADGLAVEADLFGMISSTDEMKEGMRAFLEKRKPDWKT